MNSENLQQFYIPEEQSIYLLSHQDAKKLRDWIELCCAQLEQLGYSEINLIGKGAYGFVFGGRRADGREFVFKFSRINLPQSVQDRLEEEAFMLEQLQHVAIPRLVAFQRVGRQSILMMQRAAGVDLEQYSLRHGPMPARLLIKIAAQLVKLLQGLQGSAVCGQRCLVHGDIKPSNLVFDAQTETVALVDWGSAVFAQQDRAGQSLSAGVLDLMSNASEHSNARMGDVYFIGEQQLNAQPSSPRFDEQGVAATLYALASGQSSRFGSKVISPLSLGLPIEFARVLDAMLSEDAEQRRCGEDYFVAHMARMARTVVLDLPAPMPSHLIPVWVQRDSQTAIETVVYSSRKAFLVEAGAALNPPAADRQQFARYYKNFMQGMGDSEKAFVVAVGRLGKYPVVGGLVVRWEQAGVSIDSSLRLYDERLYPAFAAAVNTIVQLARGIRRQGVFKSCLFDARHTLHIERTGIDCPFVAGEAMKIAYEVSDAPELENRSRVHSYFEDGPDPEELLVLPPAIMNCLEQLNGIHHTGMIIFESLPTHLKIHSHYHLLDAASEDTFAGCLTAILAAVSQIKGLGVSGFMKLPYKDTRVFALQEQLPPHYYPANPRAALAQAASGAALSG